jgi:hypothetical protein
MKPKIRSILEIAIAEGALLGYRRAFKHNPEPHEDAITDSIVTEIMNSIDEYFDFDSNYET